MDQSVGERGRGVNLPRLLRRNRQDAGVSSGEPPLPPLLVPRPLSVPFLVFSPSLALSISLSLLGINSTLMQSPAMTTLQWTRAEHVASQGADLGWASFPAPEEPPRLRSTARVRLRGNTNETPCFGHPYHQFWVSTSSIRSHDCNGGLISKHVFLRWIIKTLNVDQRQMRPYF